MASSSSSSPPIPQCHHISLDEIKDATNNFGKTNLLGEGGEGEVYIGEIRVDQIMIKVAVKRLSKKKISESFQSEIKIVSKFQHPNLVSLLGYCDESGEKILLYEYMEKGSLTSYIKEKSSISLSWLQRLRICLDAARGLQHVHVETVEFPKGIIHRDVKPDNILLDKNWVAKISDFGLLKLSNVDQTQSTMATALKGTCRYFAPEYVMNRSISRAADIYAFGVVMFQVLCLKFPWDRGNESYYFMDDEDLGDWAQQNVDFRIKVGIRYDSLLAFTAIVGKSLKVDHRKRPTMDEVVLGLENALKFQLLEDEGEHLQPARESAARESVVREDDDFRPEAPRLLRQNLQRYCDHISLKEIRHATDNFNEDRCVGKGKKGNVYCAVVRLGKNMTPVAVKPLTRPEYYERAFEREFKMVSMIYHRNLESLLGYCHESGQIILLYEYMEKGSLSRYLNKSTHISLSWQKLVYICLDVARGLQYLHSETVEFPKGIIHRNVTTANILLGKNWEAKLSSIEIGMLFNTDQNNTALTTVIQGFIQWYQAPEYMMFGTLTTKIDVYAFGMLLFELLCNKLPRDIDDYTMDDDLGIFAQRNVDTRFKEEICDDCLNAFTPIIGKSLEKDYTKRTTMDEVVLDLEKVLKCKECYKDEAVQLGAAREPDEESTEVWSQGSQSQDKRGGSSSSRRSNKFINSILFWRRHD